MLGTMKHQTVRRPERKAKPFARAVPPPAKSLRERKLEVVRLALSAAAEQLFLSRGFERTTVEQVARAAGVSRRTFFRYYESKEDVLAERAERWGERLYLELAARPREEPPLLAIRNALLSAVEAGIQDADFIRWVIRVLRERSALRRVMMERRNRLEERIAALMTARLRSGPSDNTPMLLAFVTRALHDTAFNAWYDHETKDVAGLVDGLIAGLRSDRDRAAFADDARGRARPDPGPKQGPSATAGGPLGESLMPQLLEPDQRGRGAGGRAVVSLAMAIWALACAGTVAAAETPAATTREATPKLLGRKYPPRIYETVRLQGPPPTIDGRLDDAAWSQGEWAGGYTQQAPTEGAAPSQPTELKILYDGRAVYVAIRAYDDPAKVRRYPGRRDDFLDYAVDVVGVCFDSYDDKRTGFEFDLTAGGSRIDLVLGNGETEWDTTWDAVWDGKVGHDEKGWTAEFRIPLNQLRYGPQDEQVWGMHAWRWIARNQEEDQWQLIPRQNSGRMYNLGELHGIRGLPRSRHVELLPHVVGKSSTGPETARWQRADGLTRPRRQARPDDQLHPGRHGQPRFRPGGGRPLGRQPDRVRDLL